jgi:hypothetical protein
MININLRLLLLDSSLRVKLVALDVRELTLRFTHRDLRIYTRRSPSEIAEYILRFDHAALNEGNPGLYVEQPEEGTATIFCKMHFKITSGRPHAPLTACTSAIILACCCSLHHIQSNCVNRALNDDTTLFPGQIQKTI